MQLSEIAHAAATAIETEKERLPQPASKAGLQTTLL